MVLVICLPRVKFCTSYNSPKGLGKRGKAWKLDIDWTAGLAAVGRAALLAAVLLVSMGARHRTANFIIETPDPDFAQQLAQAAEKYRHDLAIEWTRQADAQLVRSRA